MAILLLFLFVFISFYVFLPPLARFKKCPPVMPSVDESENKLYNFTQNQDFDIDNFKKFRAFEVRLQSLTVSNESRLYYIYMGATASLVSEVIPPVSNYLFGPVSPREGNDDMSSSGLL